VNDDPRILPQFPGELAVADIDGMYAFGAARQQHIGEAAGRGTNIERDLIPNLDREMIECVGELEAAARDPGMIAPFEREGCVRGKLFAGFVNAVLAAAHQAGEDQRLRLRAGLR
jgi:hypothetical protein